MSVSDEYLDIQAHLDRVHAEMRDRDLELRIAIAELSAWVGAMARDGLGMWDSATALASVQAFCDRYNLEVDVVPEFREAQ